MNDKERNQEMDQRKDRFSSLLEELEGINRMMDDFLGTEAAGMIICENCLDNVYDDDEDICSCEDDDGVLHQFCCRQCMNEWKSSGPH